MCIRRIPIRDKQVLQSEDLPCEENLLAYGLVAPQQAKEDDSLSVGKKDRVKPPAIEAGAVGIKRFGIISDPDDHWDKKGSELKRVLVKAWLKHGFSHAFILVSAEYTFCEWENVTCLGQDDLESVMDTVLAGNPEAVFYMQNGHGGGRGGRHRVGGRPVKRTVAQLNRLSKKVQRVIRLTECSAATVADFDGIRDDNDLLISYSGRDITVEGGDPDKLLLNYLDKAEMGFVDGGRPDPTNDGIDSLQEMFWRGQIWSYVYKRFPLTRGFVYSRGPEFVDRGFGEVAAKHPFPVGVTDIGGKTGTVDLVSNLADSYEKGITVIGYDVGKNGKRVRELLDKLSKEYPGWINFLWVDRETSLEHLDDKALKGGGGVGLFHFSFSRK